MKDLGTKLCMFVFLVALFSGRTTELGVLAGAVAGTILLMPVYRRLVGSSTTGGEQRKASASNVRDADAGLPL